MATYVIGDVQGCYRQLVRLLDHIEFDSRKDKLWFVGDLVNRGPNSLKTIELVMDLGDSANSVLGNHDLHFLAVASGVESWKYRDTFNDILHSRLRDKIVDWLRTRPLMHREKEYGYTIVHAGIWPSWTLKKARRLANEIEEILSSSQYKDFLRNMYGNEPGTWTDDLTGWARYRFITNAFTRMRFINADGSMNLKLKGPAIASELNVKPWVKLKHEKWKERIVFGHWSALGLYHDIDLIGLDTGCVWNGSLTAVRLDVTPARFYSVPCK